MKKFQIHYIITIIAVFFLAACKKEGRALIKPVKAIKPFELSGYVIGDELEQYFDGVKIRDLYGRISLGYVNPQLAFENDVTVMQFKKKSTGQVVYEQTFNINDAKNVVPKFLFDGTKVTTSYQYPKPQGNDYLVNFYVDGPKDIGPVDIQIEVLEYYYDNNNQLVVVKTTGFPIASNVALGKFTHYVKIQPVPEITPSQTGTELYPVVTIKNSKTKKYIVGDDVLANILQVEIPDQWTSQGKTQSIHIQAKLGDNKSLYLELNDLVNLF